MKKQIRTVVGMAVMMALYVVLSRFTITTGPYKIGLSGLPLILCALLYGPSEAFFVGLIGAFIGQLLDGYGITPTTILWILPPAMRGLIVGLIMKKKKAIDNITLLMFSIIISSLIVTILNTIGLYVDSKLYEYYTYYYVFGSFLSRIVLSIITSIIYCLLIPIVLNPILQFNLGFKKHKKIKREKERNNAMATSQVKRTLFNRDAHVQRKYVIRVNRDRSKGLVRRAN